MSVRTLRFYDRIGLLAPSQRSEAGYRLYSDTDLVRLQQILALKFLGFSLDEIKLILQASPLGLREALAQQHAMLCERRTRLDAVIQATEQAERLMETESGDWTALVNLIQAIQMNHNADWRKKYFTDEQLETMDQLIQASYSDEAKAALASRPTWTEQDQQRVDEQYAALYAGVRRAVAAGQDSAGVEAQALAQQAVALLEAFAAGHPVVETGLQSWWANYQSLPADQRPFQVPLSEEEAAFLEQAKAVYAERRRKGDGA